MSRRLGWDDEDHDVSDGEDSDGSPSSRRKFVHTTSDFAHANENEDPFDRAPSEFNPEAARKKPLRSMQKTWTSMRAARTISQRRESMQSQHLLREKDDLEELNNTLAKQVHSLEERCEALQEQFEALERERDMLREEQLRKSKTVAAHRTSVDTQGTGLTTLVKSIVQKQRKDRGEKVHELGHEVDTLHKMLEAAKAEAKAASQREAKLQDQMNIMQMELNALRQDRDMAICTGLQLQEELSELRDMLANRTRKRGSDDHGSLHLRKLSAVSLTEGPDSLAAQLEMNLSEIEDSEAEDEDAEEHSIYNSEATGHPPPDIGAVPAAVAPVARLQLTRSIDEARETLAAAAAAAAEPAAMQRTPSRKPIADAARLTVAAGADMVRTASTQRMGRQPTADASQLSDAATKQQLSRKSTVEAAQLHEMLVRPRMLQKSPTADAARLTVTDAADAGVRPRMSRKSNTADAARASVAGAVDTAVRPRMLRKAPTADAGRLTVTDATVRLQLTRKSTADAARLTAAGASDTAATMRLPRSPADDAAQCPAGTGDAASTMRLPPTDGEAPCNPKPDASNRKPGTAGVRRPAMAKWAKAREKAKALTFEAKFAPESTQPSTDRGPPGAEGEGRQFADSAPPGDVGGSCGMPEGEEMKELWAKHRLLERETEELRKENARLRWQTARLQAELGQSREVVAELQERWQSAVERCNTAEGAVAMAAASREPAEADEPNAECLRWDDGHSAGDDGRKRAQTRKDKLRAWAKEAEAKLGAGAVVKLLRTVIYKFAADTENHYELPAGLTGTVATVDADGDAEVDWEGIGRKWLLRKDFYKVTVEVPAPVQKAVPAKAASPRACLGGAAHFAVAASRPVHNRDRRRNSKVSAATSATFATSTTFETSGTFGTFATLSPTAGGADREAQQPARYSTAPPPTDFPWLSHANYFKAGDFYLTASAVILRATEEMESDWKGELEERTRVCLLATGVDSNRRVFVRCEATGLEGWMSKWTKAGKLLLLRAEPLQCPKGHPLQPSTESARGSCDGCAKGIEAGSKVMDCRECNWYLCETCHPQDQGPSEPSESSAAKLASVRQRRADRVAMKRKSVKSTALLAVPEVSSGPPCSTQSSPRSPA